MSKNKRQFCSIIRRNLINSPGRDFLQSDHKDESTLLLRVIRKVRIIQTDNDDMMTEEKACALELVAISFISVQSEFLIGKGTISCPRSAGLVYNMDLSKIKTVVNVQ